MKAILLATVLVLDAMPAMAQPASPSESGYAPRKPDFDRAEAVRRLGDTSLVYWVDGPTLRIAARSSAREPRLCCTFQPPMYDLSDGIWGLMVEVPELDRSVIQMILAGDATVPQTYRGPQALPDPVRVEALKGRVETVEIDSFSLKEKRKVTIYRPAVPPPATGYPVIYMADGQSTAVFALIVESLIDQGLIQPVMMVGLWHGTGPRDGGWDQRNREYLPSAKVDPAAYQRHSNFVLTEVMPLAEKTYGASRRRDDRLTYGFSSGGSWAMSFALRHPDVFAKASAAGMSAGPDNFAFTGEEKVALYLTTGRYDQFYQRNLKTCQNAQAAGVACRFTGLYAGHDSYVWNHALVESLKASFSLK
ncbi:esterase family protein [Asticcacaulis sp. YBE204]|uniref:alpha/beta hydrolase n=1 Tax=Asticcacaulis sp. YBE204 TaxID=1282363 RepID=UPI0003C3C41A|nr:alpha/beta hydrolase-fold protein [Asticcacaulis sp. YBE204]ESQ77996.1 hypothetical protein AEYBE204_15990 [Asticcacaulis sp. YBE204]